MILCEWIKEHTFLVSPGKSITCLKKSSKRPSKLRYFYFTGTLAVVFIISSPCRCYCDVLYVPEDYETIQDAVDNAADGDTIQLVEGEFNEQISISRDPASSSFFGSVEGETIWTSDDERNYPILAVQHSELTVRRITFRDSQDAKEDATISSFLKKEEEKMLGNNIE